MKHAHTGHGRPEAPSPVRPETQGPHRGDRPEVAAVADNLVVLIRAFNKARARMLAAAAHDVEWSAHVLLKQINIEGPMRAGALAEALHSDPSTVSRQVAALVREGLLERRADPDDGRASLLVLTAKADDVLAEQDDVRIAFFAEVLHDWSRDELATFAHMLDRFAGDYAATNYDSIPARFNVPTRSGGSR